MTFIGCLLYKVWMCRNKVIMIGKHNIHETAKYLNYMVEEFHMSFNFSKCGKPSCSVNGSTWFFPLAGWIKVNVDATWSEHGVAVAFVVWDFKGKLLFLSSTTTSCMSLFLVEVKLCDRLWIMLSNASGNRSFGTLMHNMLF